MSLPLLATKFHLPAVGKKQLPRPRLLAKLNAGWEQKASLFLICGPAGYGKTSIVSEWLGSSQILSHDQFAWLALDCGDDDLTRFLTYFVNAVQHIHPGFGEGVLRMLKSHKPQPPAVLATLLINELCAIPRRLLLILDDYYQLTAQPIQTFMNFLVEHQPPEMSLVFITRSDPPLPLARLRARGQLLELRQDDLRFTAEEVSEYLSLSLDLRLTQEQMDFLAMQTEGWISGLQLAAISLRDAPDRNTFLRAFSGEHEFIADYLAEEVLGRLNEPLRLFLLKTSILERFSAPLCEAVTGQTGAQAVIEQLVEDSLFIMPLDSQHVWYRYHTLFADLLRKRLQEMTSEDINDLHRRASRWFQDNKLFELAIGHALNGQDYNQAAELISLIAESYITSGGTTAVLGWLEKLPKEVILERPYLAVLHGFALILCGRPPQEAAGLVTEIETAGRLAEVPGEVMTLQALTAILQGKAAEAIQLAEQAIQQLPAQRSFFRILAADSLGMAYTLAGNIEAAIPAFEQVVELSIQTDNLMMTLMALTNLAGLRYVQGHLRLAIATCKQVVDLASQRIGRRTPIIGKTLFNLGEMIREQGDLDTALNYLHEAAGMMEYFLELGLPLTNLGIARVYIHRKDWATAQSYIDTARQQAEGTHSTLMDDRIVEVMQARLWIARGEHTLAHQWARQRGLLDNSPADLIAEAGRNALLNEIFQSEYLTLVRLALAQHQPARAIEMTALLQELVEKRGQQRRIIELSTLKALALHQNGEIEQALQALEQALSLGEPEGYQRIFVDEGEPMARLLYLAAARGISPDYAGRLMAVLAEESQVHGTSTPSSAGDLIEPLSARELEVLALLSEGLTNGEIAGRLYISLSTVKGHTANIFGKLGVNNRTHAVARARSLGLLVTQ